MAVDQSRASIILNHLLTFTNPPGSVTKDIEDAVALMPDMLTKLLKSAKFIHLDPLQEYFKATYIQSMLGVGGYHPDKQVEDDKDKAPVATVSHLNLPGKDKQAEDKDKDKDKADA